MPRAWGSVFRLNVKYLGFSFERFQVPARLSSVCKVQLSGSELRVEGVTSGRALEPWWPLDCRASSVLGVTCLSLSDLQKAKKVRTLENTWGLENHIIISHHVR